MNATCVVYADYFSGQSGGHFPVLIIHFQKFNLASGWIFLPESFQNLRSDKH